ncbi:hypothetical protein [Haloferax chudinovii]|uniref:Uncharacterized protein n=1 Tax=Haloferax chudinovii TaxID=1109010 RepID=A0ABD5XJB7_9EURY
MSWLKELFKSGISLAGRVLFSVGLVSLIFVQLSGIIQSHPIYTPLAPYDWPALGIVAGGLLILFSTLIRERSRRVEQDNVRIVPTVDSDTELSTLLEEAQTVVGHQVSSIQHLRTDAIQLIKLNLLLASILISAIAIGIDSDSCVTAVSFVNVFTQVGSGLLTFSIFSATYLYVTVEYTGGVSGDTLDQIFTSQEHSQVFVENWLLSGYEKWIRGNSVVQRDGAVLIGLSTLLTISALVMFGKGFLVAVECSI